MLSHTGFVMFGHHAITKHYNYNKILSNLLCLIRTSRDNILHHVKTQLGFIAI